MKSKKNLINVQPKSKKAVNRFKNIMSSLHAMEVEQETETQLFVVSINRKYCFWMNKQNDPNWEVIK
jgi:negative regulator of replication initiation